MKQCDSRTIDGLPILSPYKKAMDRVDAGLSLIRLHDPVRYRRLTRDLKRIWLRHLPGCIGRFDPPSWTCELDSRFVQDNETTTEMVAALIVHEATHARLWRHGIRYEENIRFDVEGVCIRREIAFSAKLPEGGLVRQRAARKLDALSNMDLSDAAKRKRLRERMEGTLRGIGMPQWIVKLLLDYGDWLHHRRLARATHRPAR
ncbi:hypothetical protein [Mesorhizobium sp. WSM2239]|uniref:SprT-like domain-containing protein n=2 Tax=unclassified Mesorhizobium TaxID=325217 RepID=A0AAU8DB49_9HYPH